MSAQNPSPSRPSTTTVHSGQRMPTLQAFGACCSAGDSEMTFGLEELGVRDPSIWPRSRVLTDGSSKPLSHFLYLSLCKQRGGEKKTFLTVNKV